MPRITPVVFTVAVHVIVFLRATDASGLHAHVGREVRRTEAHGLHAGTALGNVFDMRDAHGGFDDAFKRQRLFVTHGNFDRADQRIDGIDVVARSRLGDHDHVETPVGLLKQINHVFVPVLRIKPVDPHAERFVAPIDVIDRLNGVFTRDIFVSMVRPHPRDQD